MSGGMGLILNTWSGALRRDCRGLSDGSVWCWRAGGSGRDGCERVTEGCGATRPAGTSGLTKRASLEGVEHGASVDPGDQGDEDADGKCGARCADAAPFHVKQAAGAAPGLHFEAGGGLEWEGGPALAT